MAKYPYARYVAEIIRDNPQEDEQEIRKEYFGSRGRVVKYDEYAKFCKAIRHEPDNPPEDYWEWKGNPIATGAGVGIGLLTLFGWFLGGIIGGSTGSMGKER